MLRGAWTHRSSDVQDVQDVQDVRYAAGAWMGKIAR